MTVVHTYFYTVVDTQGGCQTLKKINASLNYPGIKDFGKIV